MISSQFFDWARDSSAPARAAGAASLVCDFFHMELTSAEAAEVEAILTVLLEDPSPLVRAALAEGLASEARAPRHLLVRLAADQPDIAAIVLGRSPLFTAFELIEAIRQGGAALKLAIARRPGLPAEVASVLLDTGDGDILLALATNHGACLSESILLRMVESAGENPRLREALIVRDDLSAPVRVQLARAVGDALSSFLSSKGWLSSERCDRALREAREKLIVAVSTTPVLEERGAPAAAASLVRHLRVTGQLTPALLLRSLLSGDALLMEAALAELADLPRSRAAALAGRAEGPGFRALYRRAGLPDALAPVFESVLRAIAAGVHGGAKRTALSRPLVVVALQACAGIEESERGKIFAMLSRFETEAAREGVRDMVRLIEQPIPLAGSPPKAA